MSNDLPVPRLVFHGWTAEPPTQPGWYWQRRPGFKASLVRIEWSLDAMRAPSSVLLGLRWNSEYWAPLTELQGEWCPVQDPPL